MKAQELRNKIEQVLGDNLRCLLPSYWWKNLFHSVVDRIDDVEEKVDKKADGVTIVSSEDALYSLNLPKGSMASVTKEGGKISECYRVMEGDLDNIESLWDRFTRVRCIEKNDVEIEVSNEMGILVAFASLELLSGNGEKYSTGQIFVGSDGTSVNIQCFSYDGTNTHAGISALNKLLGQNDLRLYNVICEGISEEEALVILDQLFTINGTSDVYAKGADWEKLAKESDITGEGLIFGKERYAYVSKHKDVNGNITELGLSEEHMAYNQETYEMLESGDKVYLSYEGTFWMQVGYAGSHFYFSTASMILPYDNKVFGRIIELSSDGEIALAETLVGGSSSDITVDTEMSDTSENAVQNKVVYSELQKKQSTISDLADIRNNAAKGATALQSVPSEYITESELIAKNYATTSALNNKVDKVSGKQLSTEDFTSALKTKLEGLSNYDDTTLSNAISGLETRLNTLVSGDASTAIESFNEIMAFLDGIKDTQDLASIIASIEQQIAGKQDKITDLEAIRSGAAKGATALQSEQYKGTVTGVKINGTTKNPSSGIVDLGTVITSHQDISGKQDNLVSGTNIKTINGQSILGEGNIEIKTEVDTSSFATREELTSLQDEIIANEEVYAAAANDLLARASDNEERISSEIDARETLQEEFQMLKTSIIENEEIIAATLNDIEGRFGYWSDTYATKKEAKDGVQEVTNAMLENEEVIAAALANLNEQIATLRTQVESLISAE